MARTLANLAGTLIDNGKPIEGEKVARESLALHRRLYGAESAEVASVLHDLGIALSRLGRNPEAEQHLREAVDIDRKLPPTHAPQLEHDLKTLALVLLSQGKLAEAEAPRRERVELGRADLERQRRDPSSLEDRIYELADNLYNQGKYLEADSFYRELIQRRSVRMAAEDEELLNAKASRARLLADWAWADRSEPTNSWSALQRAQEAEGLLTDCLAVWLQSTNRGHWRVSDVQSRLGGAIVSGLVIDSNLKEADRQPRFREAETLLLQSHERLLLHTAPNTKQKRGTIERLVRLYEIWNKPAQAVYWRNRLAVFDDADKSKTTSADASPTTPSSSATP